MSVPAFALPAALEAHAPPEARGVARDHVRLLVARRGDGTLAHHRFADLPALLAPGDVLVVNTSATVPAAIDGVLDDGRRVTVHVSTPAPHLPSDWWAVELRTPGGAAPWRSRARRGAAAGARRPARADGVAPRVTLAGGASLDLVAPYARGPRLWLARHDGPAPLRAHLARHGRPIRYAHTDGDWPLATYQTVFARQPGSAEMPSAARPFTAELVRALVAAHVVLAPVQLHTGVSSPEAHEPPYPERFVVSGATARRVNRARGRVIAVGTTAVRALESATDEDGAVRAAEGWTPLVIGPDRPLRRVDGLITGWHEPQASHLRLLEAVAGTALLEASYDAALAAGYLWHEFGDSHLVLP